MSKFKNIAVLIDAENANSNQINQIFDKINSLGNITIRHVYGDFKQSNLKIWDTLSLKYVLKQIHTPALVKGKNSSDIALVIDAMDLLFHGNNQGEFDCFCIVSSDSDFSMLAKYIRHRNKSVIGFGRNSTLDSFKMSCNKFINIDEHSINETNINILPIPTNKLKQNTTLMNALRDSIKQTLKDGWSNYSQLNSYLNQNYPNIRSKDYGYNNWRSLIEKIDLFETKTTNSALFIRLKNNISGENNQKTETTTLIHDGNKLKRDTILINALRDSIIKTRQDDGWANYSQINSYLKQNYPNLNPKNYGYSKWRTLIEQIDLFDIKTLKSALFIKDKNNKQIHNKKLIDDILIIINENTLRTDEWIHIGYLGSQLKSKGYNPKKFGFKSFTSLLENIDGVISKKVNNGYFFTLKDKSKIIEIIDNEEHYSPYYFNSIENADLYYQNFGKMPDSSIDYIDECGYPHWD